MTPDEKTILAAHNYLNQEPLPGREALYAALVRRGLLAAQTERSVLCRYKTYRLTEKGRQALDAYDGGIAR